MNLGFVVFYTSKLFQKLSERRRKKFDSVLVNAVVCLLIYFYFFFLFPFDQNLRIVSIRRLTVICEVWYSTIETAIQKYCVKRTNRHTKTKQCCKIGNKCVATTHKKKTIYRTENQKKTVFSVVKDFYHECSRFSLIVSSKKFIFHSFVHVSQFARKSLPNIINLFIKNRFGCCCCCFYCESIRLMESKYFHRQKYKKINQC